MDFHNESDNVGNNSQNNNNETNYIVKIVSQTQTPQILIDESNSQNNNINLIEIMKIILIK